MKFNLKSIFTTIFAIALTINVYQDTAELPLLESRIVVTICIMLMAAMLFSFYMEYFKKFEGKNYAGNMLHKKLSSVGPFGKPNYYYGVNLNHDHTRVLLQLGDDHDQVRVQLTPEEIDKICAELNQKKELLNDQTSSV
jgi:hypothetical protein